MLKALGEASILPAPAGVEEDGQIEFNILLMLFGEQASNVMLNATGEALSRHSRM
jgi:hypothetical protein